jgi:hypothetical protein
VPEPGPGQIDALANGVDDAGGVAADDHREQVLGHAAKRPFAEVRIRVRQQG